MLLAAELSQAYGPREAGDWALAPEKALQTRRLLRTVSSVAD